MFLQALEYSTKAVHLASSNQEKSDAFSTRGTVLKDLKQLDEAAKVNSIIWFFFSFEQHIRIQLF